MDDYYPKLMAQQDPVDEMYKAVRMVLFPHSPACLRAFQFDRCTDWTELFGLYQGIMVVIEKSLGRSYRQEFRQAVKDHRAIACMEDIYNRLYQEFPDHTASGYWLWFQSNRTQLMPRCLADSAVPQSGDRVRIRDLKATPELNDALGKVAGPMDDSTGRFPIRIRNPASAIRQFPDGVRVKAANLEVLPPGGSAAVLVIGFTAHPAYAFGTPANEGWRKCTVPHMLGLPLMMLQLAPNVWIPKEQNEQPGTLLLINPFTGFAPVQPDGLWPVLVARSDGKDFNVEDFWKLHDYNMHLMDCWPEFTPETRQQALKRAAFERHVQLNPYNPYRTEEDEDEEWEEEH